VKSQSRNVANAYQISLGVDKSGFGRDDPHFPLLVGVSKGLNRASSTSIVDHYMYTDVIGHTVVMEEIIFVILEEQLFHRC
jgi:hypothetical protein